ncbi:MAG: immunoglobulin domain-containing protein [Candidatus Saccharibacteria bacterium]
MVVIAPIVILVIGAFVFAIIKMTGDVMATRGANILAYNIQDALNRIEQDVKISGGFLATNNLNLNSPQGYKNSEVKFKNVGQDNNPAIILNSYATTTNPLDSSRNIIYKSGDPSACDSPQLNNNSPIMVNIVYFVSDGTLWRRTITSTNYNSISCGIPWQKPSCLNVEGFCQSKDTRLVDNVSSFSVQYLSLDNNENRTASDPDGSDVVRQEALALTNKIAVSITAINKAANNGTNNTFSGSIQAISPNNNTLAADDNTIDIAIKADPNNQKIAVGDNAVFTVAVSGTKPTIYWQQSIDNGANWSNVNNSTSSTLSIDNVSNTMDGYLYRAKVESDSLANYITSNSAQLMTYDRSPIALSLVSGWANDGQPFAIGSYIKTSDGIVMLRGLVHKESGNSTEIATLPQSYCPAQQLTFITTVAAGSSLEPARVDISSNCKITLAKGNQEGRLFLDGISFVPNNHRYKPTLIAEIEDFHGGWTNYKGGYAPASYVTDDSGRVNLQGLVVPGVFTMNTIIFTMPNNKSPEKKFFRPSQTNIANNVFSSFVVSVSEGVLARGIATGWISTQAMYYPKSSAVTWTALSPLAPWSTYTDISPVSPLQYTKSRDGVVSLRGMIQGGGISNSIATLPSGYRPTQIANENGGSTVAYAVSVYAQNNVDSLGRISITNAGEITFTGSSSTWVSLDGINFYAG